MKVVATVSAEEAAALVEFLQRLQIPSQAQPVTEESGLELTGVLVDDGHFEQACDAIEQWEATRPGADKPPAKRTCPACGAPELEHADEIDYLNTMTKMAAIYHCTNCGYVFAVA